LTEKTRILEKLNYHPLQKGSDWVDREREVSIFYYEKNRKNRK